MLALGIVVLIPVALYLIGADFTLVGDVCIPATGVMAGFWEIDKLGNDGFL